MNFVGIDLAAQARQTGVAVLRDDGRVRLESVQIGVDDDDLVAAVQAADRAGVDVPLGWPVQFAEFINAHATGSLSTPDSTGSDWRRGLAMRATDLHVHRLTGLMPLSVSTDRIAYPAMRWAGVEARLRESGTDISRDGSSGVVVEVYPAAALYRWSLIHRGYKGSKNAAMRTTLVRELAAMIPWLDWSGHQDLCLADDNALDAVVAALVAREVSMGSCETPSDLTRSQSQQEGWIWLPDEHGPSAPL